MGRSRFLGEETDEAAREKRKIGSLVLLFGRLKKGPSTTRFQRCRDDPMIGRYSPNICETGVGKRVIP
jgi:hypothetical protein